MSFLSSQEIKEKLPLLVKGGDATRVTSACYELGLGDEACITPVGEGRKKFRDGKQIVIPPGQFGVLVSEEEITLPKNMLAFISIKSKKKMIGLVNVSGFHVDPGFTGRLKFSVYNAGAAEIYLDVGRPLFLIWFSQLANDDPMARTGPPQAGILDEDVSRLRGDVVTPNSIKMDIEGLKREFWYWKTVAITIIGILLTLLARANSNTQASPTTPSPTTPPTATAPPPTPLPTLAPPPTATSTPPPPTPQLLPTPNPSTGASPSNP